MIAQLVPVAGGVPITIQKDVTIVGRQPEHCDIVIERKSVSKIHCVLAKTDGLLFVRDLDSTNGTKVNGQRIIRGALLPGDQLAFAGEKFRVHLGPSPVTPNVSPNGRTQELDETPRFSEAPFADESEKGPGADSEARISDAEDLVE